MMDESASPLLDRVRNRVRRVGERLRSAFAATLSLAIIALVAGLLALGFASYWMYGAWDR
jgi:hypothetical protein